MKKILLSVLLMGSTIVVFNSCSNGAYNANPDGSVSTDPNPLYHPPGYGIVQGNCVCKSPMSGDVDTKEWVADTAYVSTDTTISSSRILAITGHNNLGISNPDYNIVISIAGYTGTGTYTCGIYNNATATFVDQANVLASYSTAVASGLGTVIVTKDSGGQLQGNFSFTAYNGTNSHAISGGYFNVKH